LIFTSEKNGKGTREVIAELQSGKRSAVPEADRTGRISAPLNGRNKGGAGVNSGSSALFIPGFTSKSTIKIKNHDVDVIEPAILTLNGEQVNSLLLDERYVYTFNVRFGFDATEVSFGSQIKSEAGVTVSLASLNNSRSYIPHLERGIYRVEWEFDCKLMPGTYFFDTSVAGLVDSERTLFCRLKDSVVFKVQQQKRSMYAGIVSLNQTISYKQLG
jgi:lipopolysaccharide transport system ATP-binding protein